MLQRLQQQLSLRDQSMLALLVAAVLLYVLYQALWRPLATANQLLIVQNTAATQSLASIGQLAAQYRTLQQGATQNNASQGESLTQLVDETIASNGLHMSRFQPGSSGDAQVRLDNASFDAALHWLAELEGKHSVTIRELGIAPGSAPGQVNISVRLYRP